MSSFGQFSAIHTAQRVRAYAEAKRLSTSPNSDDRRKVAANRATAPEFLFLLANDPNPAVRAAVAANIGTPSQADLLLARDTELSVREDLAQKIARLAPNLGAREQDRICRTTYQVLEILARDEIGFIRAIISEALKESPTAPAEIVRQLARDTEIAVAGPVLQYSPVLTDGDLLDIIKSDPIAGACAAVAKRSTVSEWVAAAIGESDDVQAIAALLANPCAQIREDTLDRLIEQAAGQPCWHEPLVRRPRLPGGAARRLARFVAETFLQLLAERDDLDTADREAIEQVLRARLSEAEDRAAPPDPVDPALAALERAKALHGAGELTAEAIDEAVDYGDRRFIRAALAVLSGFPLETIDRILASDSAKGIVALCWRCGVGMHLALRLQMSVARVGAHALLRPKADGSYPLSEDAMRWHLEFLADLPPG